MRLLPFPSPTAYCDSCRRLRPLARCILCARHVCAEHCETDGLCTKCERRIPDEQNALFVAHMLSANSDPRTAYPNND
jgi:hypothetical protein